jgi:hypothetical protein
MLNSPQELYEMELHECRTVSSPYMQITRVPGGWIYTTLPVNDLTIPTSTFVPYDNEFQPGRR